jgi:hypothetical protein
MEVYLNMFKKNNENAKYFNVKPELKRMYGRHWVTVSAIERNTKVLEEILEQIKILNQAAKNK